MDVRNPVLMPAASCAKLPRGSKRPVPPRHHATTRGCGFQGCRHPPAMLEDAAGVTEGSVTTAPGFKALEKPNCCFWDCIFLRAAGSGRSLRRGTDSRVQLGFSHCRVSWKWSWEDPRGQDTPRSLRGSCPVVPPTPWGSWYWILAPGLCFVVSSLYPPSPPIKTASPQLGAVGSTGWRAG